MSEPPKTPPSARFSNFHLYQSENENTGRKSDHQQKNRKKIEFVETISKKPLKNTDNFVKLDKLQSEYDEARCSLTLNLRHSTKDLNFDDPDNMVVNFPFLYEIDYSWLFMKYNKIEYTDNRSIYIVRHRVDRQKYIVKVGSKSDSGLCLSASSKEIANELRILVTIGEHPHLLTYYNSWVTDSKLYCQQEYAIGGSLSDFLQGYTDEYESNSLTRPTDVVGRVNTLSETNMYKLIVHIASALAYLHALNISHCAIRLSNILMTFSNLPPYTGIYSKKACHEVLLSPYSHANLRFKLSNLTRARQKDLLPSGQSDSELCRLMNDDLFDFGIALYECFCKHLTENEINLIKSGNRIRWPSLLHRRWKNTIMSLVDSIPDTRLAAKDIMNIPVYRKYVIPEAKELLEEI